MVVGNDVEKSISFKSSLVILFENFLNFKELIKKSLKLSQIHGFLTSASLTKSFEKRLCWPADGISVLPEASRCILH